MNELLFQPESVYWCAQFILNLTVFGYLLSVPDKSEATRWLTVAFGGSSFFALNNAFNYSLFTYTWTPWLNALYNLLIFMALGVFFWSYLHFAFRFLENPFPREAKGALVLTSLLLLVDLSASGYALFIADTEFNFVLFYFLLLLGLILWTTLVLLRKWWHTARRATSERASQAMRAFRAFTLINVLGIFLFTMIMMWTVGISWGGVLELLMWCFILGFFFGIVLVYLNHAPEPTSFQVKLIGLSLVTVLALMTAVVSVLYPGLTIEEFAIEAPQQQALRFTPDGQGGYEAMVLPYHYESDLGDDLHLGDARTRTIALGFSFPYYGVRRDSTYVSPNGAVIFSESIYRAEGLPPAGFHRPVSNGPIEFHNDLPKIAPLYMDLDPSSGGGVFLKREPNRVVITWHEVPHFRTQDLNSMQLVLHQSGAIDFVYNHIDAALTTGLRGLTPGGRASSAASLVQDLPYRVAAGTARIEDFHRSYRERTHAEVKALVWLVLGGSFFVLVVFPFFFRSSLVKPLGRLLDGVQRVNAGDLDAEVPVGVRDEIGRLTSNFNRMTQSLRRAVAELEAHAEELEDRVAARTADLNAKNDQLERTLQELKTTQQQLIHAEKMASLGGLTAGIAHEIKNPLNFVNNFAALSTDLADDITSEIETHKLLLPTDAVADLEEMLADLKLNTTKIHEHGQRATGIIGSMLEHARTKAGERQATDINALLEQYLALAYHGMRAGQPDFTVEIERDYDEAVGPVQVVPQEISRVFVNLLNNAFDAVHESAMRINGPYLPTVRVSTRQLAGQVEIRVSDNGSGIPAAVKDKIFEPFFSRRSRRARATRGWACRFHTTSSRRGMGGRCRWRAPRAKGLRL